MLLTPPDVALPLSPGCGRLRRGAPDGRKGRNGALGLTPSTRAASLSPSTTAPRPGWRSTQRVCRRGRTRRGSPGPSGDSRNNPCRRQSDRVVAPGSTGRRLLVEDDRGASGETPISSSPIAWRRASAGRHRLTGAHARMDVAVGEGSAEPRSGRSRDGRSRASVCARFRPVAVVGTRPDGALACRPERAPAQRRRRD